MHGQICLHLLCVGVLKEVYSSSLLEVSVDVNVENALSSGMRTLYPTST